jgi:hypothetical protein
MQQKYSVVKMNHKLNQIHRYFILHSAVYAVMGTICFILATTLHHQKI